MLEKHSSASKSEFQYGRSLIEYALLFEERRNLAITVRPDKSVLVRAPLGSSQERIDSKLTKRGEWILKQINYFDKFHPVQPPRQYVSGESHYYLGRQYRLRVRKGHNEDVELSGKFFIASTKNPDARDRVKLLLLDWYATQAQIVFDQRINELAPDILGPGFEKLKVEYGPMRTRWGSCTVDRQLKINIELIKTPVLCIDYVMVHELCHILHPNHDKKFYAKLAEILPDWKERKSRLEEFGV